MRPLFVCFAVLIPLLLGRAAPLHEVVASFSSLPAAPGSGALILGVDGYYWGTTEYGGDGLGGTVYKVKADGSDWHIVQHFYSRGSRALEGNRPQGGLVYDGVDSYWGTTAWSETVGSGVIFKINATTGVKTTVLSMSTIGSHPAGTLVNDGAGNMWGTTLYGGSSNSAVFRIDIATGECTAVIPATGGYSRATLVNDGAGYLWGATSVGGANGGGTIFKVHMSSAELTTVHDFTEGGPASGSQPFGGMALDGAGYLWGTTNKGGAGDFGTLFKVRTATGEVTWVMDFTGEEGPCKGGNPQGALVSDGAGSMLGTTYEPSTVFKINTTTSAFTTLHEFVDTAPGRGYRPQSGLVNSGGGFFLGTAGGGYGGNGMVFKINAATGELSTLVNLGIHPSTNEGSNPLSGLVADAEGQLWGTTFSGGIASQGTVYKVNPQTGVLTTMSDFGQDGWQGVAYPERELVGDGLGSFWGVTRTGGANSLGTVYKVNEETGTLTLVAEFNLQENGYNPSGALMRDDAGNLWGSTMYSSGSTSGSIFKIDPHTDDLSYEHFFAGDPSGKAIHPQGGLLDIGDGTFWGTTYGRGPFMGSGSVYKYEPSTSTRTTLVEFTGDGETNKGSGPTAPVVKDGQGNLWGTTSEGGSLGYGTVFKVNGETGVLTTVVDFGDAASAQLGRTPYAGLVYDGKGSLWGTTYGEWEGSHGTVFKINASTGVATRVVQFTGDGTQARSGSHPYYGALLKHADGHLYGTTELGGPGASGTIYRIRLGPTVVTASSSSVTGHTASLTGTANPNGAASTAFFEYGTSINDLNQVSAIQNVGAGASPASVTGSLTGLAPNTTYYYRLRADNEDQLQPQRGKVMSFTTMTASQDWRQTNFGSPDNTGNGADTATPKQDGVTNLMKYATGMDPTVPGSMPGMVSASADGSTVSYVYSRSDAALSEGLQYVVEWSDTLERGTWSTQGVTSSAVDQGATDVVTATVPAGEAGRRFVRLRVVR